MRYAQSFTTTKLGYELSKMKLWKGYSFPLKRSVLDAHLLNAGIEIIKGVSYLKPERVGALLYSNGNGISVYMVPSETRHLCESLLITFGLPELCRRLTMLQEHQRGKTEKCDVFGYMGIDLIRDGRHLLLRKSLPTRHPRDPMRYSTTELGALEQSTFKA